MRQLRKFLLLTATDRSLLIRAALLLGLVRLGLSLLPFQTLQRLLGKVSATSSKLHEADRAAPGQIAWAVTAASRYIPKATCLAQALTAQVLLAGQGYPTCLRIGVAKNERGGLEAHAWVENQGTVIIGGSAFRYYTPLLTLEGEKL